MSAEHGLASPQDSYTGLIEGHLLERPVILDINVYGRRRKRHEKQEGGG